METYHNPNQCCARIFNPVRHLDNRGNLIMMRPDIYNLYGDRCPFGVVQYGQVCANHLNSQPFGIWNSLYTGSLKYHMEKVPYDHIQNMN